MSAEHVKVKRYGRPVVHLTPRVGESRSTLTRCGLYASTRDSLWHEVKAIRGNARLCLRCAASAGRAVSQ